MVENHCETRILPFRVPVKKVRNASRRNVQLLLRLALILLIPSRNRHASISQTYVPLGPNLSITVPIRILERNILWAKLHLEPGHFVSDPHPEVGQLRLLIFRRSVGILYISYFIHMKSSISNILSYIYVLYLGVQVSSLIFFHFSYISCA